MSTIYLSVGNVTIGTTKTDKDGKVISKTKPQFEEDPDGACIVVGKAKFGKIDPCGQDILVPDKNVDVYGNWQAAEYLKCAVELLQPSRPINIPNFRAIVREAVRQGVDICECCDPGANQKDGDIWHTPFCGDCIAREWIEEQEERTHDEQDEN